MRGLTICCVMLLALAGCSRSSDSDNPNQRRVNGVVPPIQPERNPAWDNAPVQTEPVYESQPLSVWVEQFNRPEDEAMRVKAATVLGQLGKQGFPPLLEAMKSTSDDGRLLALQSVTKETLAEHQKETWPLLRDMLSDPNPAIRKQAADRIAWYGKENLAALKESVRLLRLMAKNDPDLQVRQVAESAINQITYVYTGRPVAGSPDDPKLPF